ncbi:alkaline phosphatase family protein [Cyclobacterium qasimii]|uniref:PA14 domain-containing protein n=1 Tax=Cyclobacterium qasimii TaxID=1350429 RepID=A0A512C7Z6_9BACT|nr:alkaline phosphatase family protein [Cyclobacterium qasimii]GEO20303.1 hypothetical protein CQA01_08370 [Cyclobacterium qasimii]
MKFKGVSCSVVLLLVLFISISCNESTTSDRKVKHTILIGLDAFGARGFQKASTPYMNKMTANGAIAPFARCLLPTNSSPNWTAMLTGVGPLQHGVYDNDWERDKQIWPPVIATEEGVYPSLINWIKDQIPSSKVHFFYEWGGLARLFDLSEVDKIYRGEKVDVIFEKAVDAFFEDQPDFLFLNIDEIDHQGHAKGHDSEEYFNAISHFDSLIGDFVQRLEAAGLMDETLIIITGDHGGINTSHGGTTLNEIEIPIIMYGAGVNKGLVISKPCYIYDVPVTLAYALGITPPKAGIGRPILEAFNPNSISAPYVPMPLISPTQGFFATPPLTVEITVDDSDAEIFYSLDGSTPSKEAGKAYSAPIQLKESTLLTSVTYKNGIYSRPEINQYRIGNGENGKISWDYYEGNFSQIPDFKSLNIVKSGSSKEFSLKEIPHRSDHFAVKFEATLQIKESGKYTFFSQSDDGSKVLLNGEVVVDNDGSHSSQLKKNQVNLSKGNHPIEVWYFEDTQGQEIQIQIDGPGVPKQILTDKFFR